MDVFLTLLFFWIAAGFGAAMFARSINYDSIQRFIGLIFLGPISLFVVGIKLLNFEDTSGRETKKCPYCAETILKEVKVCRYCGKELPEKVTGDVKSNNLYRKSQTFLNDGQDNFVDAHNSPPPIFWLRNSKMIPMIGIATGLFCVIAVCTLTGLPMLNQGLEKISRNHASVGDQSINTKSFLASINITIDNIETRYPAVTGETNLPNETILMISVKGNDFSGQDKVHVVNGRFRSAQFGSSGGLRYGIYEVEVLMPLPQVQPESVRKIIGNKGENLVGNLVVVDEYGLMVSKTTIFRIESPTPTNEPTMTPLPLPTIKELTGGDIGYYKYDEYTTISLFKASIVDHINGERPYGTDNGFSQFLVLEIEFENIGFPSDEFSTSAFYLNSISDDGRMEYFVNPKHHSTPFLKEDLLAGQSLMSTLVFEIKPSSTYFVLSYKGTCAQTANSIVITEDCGLGYPSFVILNK